MRGFQAGPSSLHRLAAAARAWRYSSWVQPRPQAVDPPLPLENPRVAQRRLERGVADAVECDRDVLGLMAVDLADEAQRHVQLLVRLPARAGYAAHRAGQRGAHRGGRACPDEQTMCGHLRCLSGFA